MMSLLRLAIASILVFLIGGVTFLLVRNGVFMSVETSVEERGPLILLSALNVGPYHKIVPALNRIEEAAKAAGLPCPETFGEYLDHPAVVEEGRLKSNVGCVLTAEPPAGATPTGLQVRTVPTRKYLVATFRGSPALGPYKVYGRSQSEIREKGLTNDGAPMEIYRPLPDGGLETIYLFPVR